uniref:Uncharacterized protein n=1 Tax=Aegilops tauschii subsp. strangulata TaxID=200361 RepID=A0A453EAX7_AEGTS
MATPQMLLPFIGKTVVDMAEKWVTMADPASGEVEIDVSEWFQIVTEDAITRTAFGRSYEDGKAVFKLQTQLMAFASEAFRKVFIPGDAHRPAAGGHGRREAPRVRQGPPRPHDQRQQQRRQERAAGQPHHRERHRGGVQDVLLRRQADDVQPPDMDHRGARHAPGVAGACQAGGPRSLRRARHPLPRAARQAQDCKQRVPWHPDTHISTIISNQPPPGK